MNLSFLVFPVFLFLGVFFGLFLFWRAGRHELHDSQFLFDLIIASILGFLLGGRLFAFLVHFDQFHFSILRLIFFNVYAGFDFYGGLLGAIFAVFVYLRKRKEKAWHLFDLASAPLAFSQLIINLGKYLQSFKVLFIFLVFGYFLIFMILKRMATVKRHVGFFACFYLVCSSILDIFIYRLKDDFMMFGIFRYYLVVPIGVLLFGVVSWYIQARRNLKEDFKAFFAQILLTFFKTKRVLTTVREADEVAKLIITLPIFLAKLIYKLFGYIAREIIVGSKDFLIAFGIKHDRY